MGWGGVVAQGSGFSVGPFDVFQTGIAVAVLLYVIIGFQKRWWANPGTYEERLQAARESHAAEVTRLQQAHASEVDRLQEAHANEVDRLTSTSRTTIERLAAELEQERREASSARATLDTYRDRVERDVLPALVRSTDGLARLVAAHERRTNGS